MRPEDLGGKGGAGGGEEDWGAPPVTHQPLQDDRLRKCPEASLEAAAMSGPGSLHISMLRCDADGARFHDMGLSNLATHLRKTRPARESRGRGEGGGHADPCQRWGGGG